MLGQDNRDGVGGGNYGAAGTILEEKMTGIKLFFARKKTFLPYFAFRSYPLLLLFCIKAMRMYCPVHYYRDNGVRAFFDRKK